MRRRGERGAITVEALIWLPLLLYVAMMTLDFGMVMTAKTIVTEAARESARYAAVTPGCPSANEVWNAAANQVISAALKDQAPSWGSASSVVPGYPTKRYLTVRCFNIGTRPYVEVEVAYLQKAIAPWLPRIVGKAPNPDYWLVSTKLVMFDER